MFRFIKQVLIVLLSFSRSLLTKFVSLNNEPCMNRPTFIHLNPVELNYYLLMISLYKYSESCNAIDDLSTKICLPRDTKRVKVFNMIARINQTKALVKHILRDFKHKFDRCQCECINYLTSKKDHIWNPSASICEDGKSLKSIVHESLFVCHKILIVIDSVQQMSQVLAKY